MASSPGAPGGASAPAPPWLQRAKPFLVGVGSLVVVLVFLVYSGAAFETFHPPLVDECTYVPCVFDMSAPKESTPATGLAWAAIKISPTIGLPAKAVEFSLDAANGSLAAAVGTAPDGCVDQGPFTTGACGAPATGVWYAVLENVTTETVAGVYGTGGWSLPSLGVNSGMLLVVVSPASAALAGSGDVLTAHGSPHATVSGTSGPF